MEFDIDLGLVLLVAIGAMLLLVTFFWLPVQKGQASTEDQIALFTKGVLERMDDGGCIGTLRWYTGTTFSQDFVRFEDEYGQKYEAHIGLLNSSNILSPAALALADPPPYDCKDAFMAGLCLAAYYPNVDCTPYFQVKDGSQHIGLICDEHMGNVTFRSTL